MKRNFSPILIALGLALSSASASELGAPPDSGSDNVLESSDAKTNFCIFSANYYVIAARRRDSDLSPQSTFEVLDQQKQIPGEAVKKIINQVYFDPRLRRAGGSPLFSQVMDLCMNGQKNWKPLK